MSITTITIDNFDQIIADNELVAIDFWAEWCEPCKDADKIFSQLTTEYPDVLFGKVNIDEQKALADEFAIRSIPTLMILRRKVMVGCESGLLPAAAIKDLLNQAKALDIDKVYKDLNEDQA